MFCSKCGTQLGDDDIFCFNCGTKIARKLHNEFNLQEINVEKKEGQMQEHVNIMDGEIEEYEEFDFYGNTITFSLSSLKEIKMLREQINKVEEYRNKILEAQLKIKGLSNIDGFESKMNEYAREYRNFVYSSLVQNGIDVLSEKELIVMMKLTKTLSKIDEFKSQLTKQLERANEDKEYALAYNKAKKASRTKLVGGGFGIKGAAKGIVTAKTVNAVTGSIYSVGNAFASASINSRYRAAVNEVNSKGLNGTLSEDFYEDCLRFLYSVYNSLEEKNVALSYSYLGKEKADKVLRDIDYDRNYDDTKESRAELAKKALDIFVNYPIEDKYFISICGHLGDENGEIRRFCKTINMDLVDVEKAIFSYEYYYNLFNNDNSDINIYNIVKRNMYGSQDMPRYYKKVLNDEFADKEKYEYAKALEEKEINNHLHYLIENCMKSFLGFGINYYLDKDYLNAPHLFMNSLKTCRIKGEDNIYTFEYGNNLEYLNGLSIDFTYQNPMCLFWCKAFEKNVKSYGEYILLTSEHLYAKNLAIPIMNIYKIAYCKANRTVIINDYYELSIVGMGDRSLQVALFSAVIFLQLLHEWGDKNKVIPLLSMVCSKMEKTYTKPLRNIYKLTKIYYLSNEGNINEMTKIRLKKLANYMLYKESCEVEAENKERIAKINEFYKINNKDEMMLLAYEIHNLTSTIGFAITNKRFIYNNGKKDRYKSIELEAFDKKKLLLDDRSIVNYIAFGDAVKIYGDDEDIRKLYNIMYSLIEEITIEKMSIPEKISYHNNDRITVLNDIQEHEKMKDKDDETVISEVFKILEAEGNFRFARNEGYIPDNKDQIRWSSFNLEEDEKVYYCYNKPILKRPQKYGYLITNKGLKYVENGQNINFSWLEIKKAKVIIDSDNIYINDNMSLFFQYYENIGMLLEKLENIWGAPLVFHMNEDGKTYRHLNEKTLSIEDVMAMVEKNREKYDGK